MPGGLRCVVLYFKFGPVVLPLLVVENRPSPLLWLLYKPMGLYNSLYYRTSRDTVIGTLAVDGWAVTFGTARGGGLGGAAARPGPSSAPRCTKCNSPPINGQCTNFVLFDVTL